MFFFILEDEKDESIGKEQMIRDEITQVENFEYATIHIYALYPE